MSEPFDYTKFGDDVLTPKRREALIAHAHADDYLHLIKQLDPIPTPFGALVTAAIEERRDALCTLLRSHDRLEKELRRQKDWIEEVEAIAGNYNPWQLADARQRFDAGMEEVEA